MNGANVLESIVFAHVRKPSKKPALIHPYIGFDISKDVIKYPAFMEAFQAIGVLHLQSRSRGEAEGLLVLAESGSGKTRLCKYYASKFPRYDEGGQTIVPVLSVPVPPSPTFGSIVSALLAGLGDPFPDKGTLDQRIRRLYLLIKACRVELIILDEFQHVSDSTKISEAQQLPDNLKAVMTTTGVPLVLAGLPRSNLIVRSNPQVKGRFSAAHRLIPFPDTAVGRKDLSDLLKTIESKLPLQAKILSSAAILQCFMTATNGLMRPLQRIVNQSVWIAGKDGRTEITHDILAQAFQDELFSGCDDALNPFLNFKLDRRLDQPGEPFEIQEPQVRSWKRRYGAAV